MWVVYVLGPCRLSAAGQDLTPGRCGRMGVNSPSTHIFRGRIWSWVFLYEAALTAQVSTRSDQQPGLLPLPGRVPPREPRICGEGSLDRPGSLCLLPGQGLAAGIVKVTGVLLNFGAASHSTDSWPVSCRDQRLGLFMLSEKRNEGLLGLPGIFQRLSRSLGIGKCWRRGYPGPWVETSRSS